MTMNSLVHDGLDARARAPREQPLLLDGPVEQDEEDVDGAIGHRIVPRAAIWSRSVLMSASVSSRYGCEPWPF
jgi:hypothetical protein